MRRQPQPRWADQDSDQSISDEEEELGRDCVSLASSIQPKEGSEILSKLELLKGNHGSGNKASDLSHTKRKVLVAEDDVEIPDFCDEDAISEEEAKNVRSKISKVARLDFGFDGQVLSNSWSFASREAEALAHLNKHALCHSKHKKSSKGVKGKGKPKFSFRFQSRRDGPSSPSISKDENNLAISEVLEIVDAIEVRTELLEDIQNDEENLPEITHRGVVEEALKHESSEQSKSMAELLDGLPRGSSRKNSSRRGKRLQVVAESREVSPDDVECYEPSSDSETSDNDVELAIPDIKGKTIVDQFEEAFGATLLNDDRRGLHSMSKSPRGGLFWRLQQVMQIEKEREKGFLVKIGNEEALQNEQSCIYVKLMSKHLEAKLTVCHCFVSDNFESLRWLEEPLNESANTGLKKKIIFNQRVFVDVDLEVGNCIRVHPPWKEVKVRNDESIILAAYFSNF